MRKREIQYTQRPWLWAGPDTTLPTAIMKSWAAQTPIEKGDRRRIPETDANGQNTGDLEFVAPLECFAFCSEYAIVTPKP